MIKKAPWLLIALLVVVSACGYSFRGGSNNLPGDVKTVAIPTFANRTTELRIDSILTDDVIYQFTRSGMLKVVSLDKADAVLHGAITSIYVSDVALTTSDTSRQRRVIVTISAKLVRTRDKKVLWKGKSLSEFRSYSVANDPVADEAAKQAAMGEAAEELAQTLHDRIFENF